jgi:hypothetical protein
MIAILAPVLIPLLLIAIVPTARLVRAKRLKDSIQFANLLIANKDTDSINV